MASSITLRSVIDTVQTSKGMKPLVGVGQVANQPGLDLCNDTLQRLFSAPYDWKFNKFGIRPFTTVAYQQDYLLSNCNAFCKGRYAVHLNAFNSANGPGLTWNGGTVTALFNDFAPNGMYQGTGPNPGDSVVIGGAIQSVFNGTFTVTAVPSNTSFQYLLPATPAVATDGGPGFNSPGINWMMSVSMSDFQNTGLVTPVHDAEIVSSLTMESIIQPPFKWAYQIERTFSQIVTPSPSGKNVPISIPLFRAWPVPSSQVWGIYLFYQGRAPLKTSLNDTWDPWPDELGYVLRSSLKASALDWWEDPRSVNSGILAQQDILRALGSKDQEARSQGMFPDLPISRGG